MSWLEESKEYTSRMYEKYGVLREKVEWVKTSDEVSSVNRWNYCLPRGHHVTYTPTDDRYPIITYDYPEFSYPPYKCKTKRFKTLEDAEEFAINLVDAENLNESTSEFTQNILNELNSLERYFPDASEVRTRDIHYNKIKEFEAVLNKFPVGTKLSQKTDAGINYYEKVDSSMFGWDCTRAPWNDTQHRRPVFDLASYMLITKLFEPFELVKDSLNEKLERKYELLKESELDMFKSKQELEDEKRAGEYSNNEYQKNSLLRIFSAARDVNCNLGIYGVTPGKIQLSYTNPHSNIRYGNVIKVYKNGAFLIGRYMFGDYLDDPKKVEEELSNCDSVAIRRALNRLDDKETKLIDWKEGI